MKCEKCSSEIMIQSAAQVRAKGCKILSNLTTIITIQCDVCRHIQQIPIKGKSVLSIKKDY
jgi:RNase P subunit RPR2